jgi:hypothetical protein
MKLLGGVMKNIIIFVLLSFASCFAQEVKNIPIEKGITISSLELSNNGSLVVLQFQKDSKEYLQLNDKTYGPFDELFQQKFSKDGSSYGYAFQKVDKLVLQVNGNDVITINRPVEFENFAFSDNGEKIELIYSENGKLFLIGDFGEYGPFENANDLFVSPNGLKFGFAYSTSDTSYFVKVNDKISGPYSQISFLRTSADYSSIGYKYATENGYMIVLNDILFGPYKYAYGPIISANGSSYGYIYEKEDGLRCFQINDKPAEQLAIGHLSFSNDGSKYCFSFFKEDKFFVRYNGKTFGPFEGLTDLRMSPDGSTWGIRYDIGYNIFIQINENIKLGPFSEVKNPVFSPSGSSFAFHFSKDEKWYAQINNEFFGPFDDVSQITFSSDGSKYCFTYTIGENQFLQILSAFKICNDQRQ